MRPRLSAVKRELPLPERSVATAEAGIFDAEKCRATLEQILASRTFRESHQLRDFLRYAVEETLANRADGLKEYGIGRAVFHRGGDFDPRLDAIVRVQASLLRKKLAAYYAHEGARDEFVLELPKGGYVPCFHPVRPAAKARRWSRRQAAAAIALLAVGGLAGMAGERLWISARRRPQYLAAPAPPSGSADPSICPEIWGGFLGRRGEVLVAYGQPRFYRGGGTYIRDVRINTGDEPEAMDLLEQLSRSVKTHLVPDDGTYTGTGELNGVVLMSNYLSHYGIPSRVLSVNTLTPQQLRGRDLILISSLRFRTLVQEMNLPMAFKFDPEGGGGIRNLTPRPGELASFSSWNGVDIVTSYALVSLWPGPSGERILHIGGLYSWSTLAAAQYVTDRAQLADLAARLRAGGKPPESFQVLLMVEAAHGEPRPARYMMHRALEIRR